jgi:hypothetical protein
MQLCLALPLNPINFLIFCSNATCPMELSLD